MLLFNVKAFERNIELMGKGNHLVENSSAVFYIHMFIRSFASDDRAIMYTRILIISDHTLPPGQFVKISSYPGSK